MQKVSNEYLQPIMEISESDGTACRSADAVHAALKCRLDGGALIAVAECYIGTDEAEVLSLFDECGFDTVINADECAFEPEKLDAALARDLTDDRVFGVMTTRTLADYFYKDKIEAARKKAAAGKRVLIYGVGASLIAKGDVFIYADITRWEIQLRYRRGLDNWRTAKKGLPKLAKYKRGFFAEWRWADKIKKQALRRMDIYLDMSTESSPALIMGEQYRAAMAELVRRPIRMAPYYDPGVWGGHWMKDKFNLPDNGSNYAWSFDGVPEENSLLLGFGDITVQTPALNLVLLHPRELLGERVYARFGAEFPIRFDLLDTVGGQNLSLQVHPLTEYIQDVFNMRYTQDESYYILDTDGDDASVWLGVCEGADKSEMESALKAAQKGGETFDAKKYINAFPVKKHDHLLIPAGTVHGAGAGTMVLEISATPYIFTFKLWDWGRIDLDGKPRPIHIEHGAKNIQYERDTEWVKENLMHKDMPVYEGARGTVERTGLDEREFIDTYRITTDSFIPIRRNGSVHMLNLVEGGEAVIESANGQFKPFTVHFTQTFILPDAAGEYMIKSPSDEEIKLMLACVRN